MKNFLFLLCCSLLLAISTPVAALTIDIYNSVENLILLENFEDTDYSDGNSIAWHEELVTAVGTFTATGNPGTGATSSGSSTAEFSINSTASWYGRYNTTPNGEYWLDSGDITELTLTLAPGFSETFNSLYFYMMDPSDCGATTTVLGQDGEIITNTVSLGFNPEYSSGTNFLVGITWDEGETLESIKWEVSSTGDGYGLDDFSTVAPVPEPATMLLFGFGLLGLAGVSRRKK